MSLTATPELKLLSAKTDLSLHLKRSLSGMDPVPTTDSALPDFVPVELILWAGREDRLLGTVDDFGCVLEPADKNAGIARWNGDRRAGYPDSMPSWVRAVSDELHASLTEGAEMPAGEVGIHAGWQRRFSVKDAGELSFAGGTVLTPVSLSVAAVIETEPNGQETESYRIVLNGTPGSNLHQRWIAPRLQGYADDIPVWAREPMETLRHEMVASTRP